MKDIHAIIKDMQGRGNALIILNLSSDDPRSPVAQYIVNHRAKELAEALRALAEEANARLMAYAPEGMELQPLNDALKLELRRGAASPVLREDSALYTALSAGEIRSNCAELAFEKTFLSYGYEGRPTLVIDPESALGLSTKLVFVNGEPREYPIGAALSGLNPGGKPALLGGALGRFVDGDTLSGMTVSQERIFDSVTTFADASCMADELLKLYTENNASSCGKCVMCREGSWQIMTILSDICGAKGKREDIPLIEDIASLIAEGALCDFGRGMVQPIITALDMLKPELEAHIIKRSCPAGVCAAFLSYVIDPAKCTGCGECMDACEYDAIEGKPQFIHMIDEKMCEKCDECVKVCPENAVLTGGERIRTPKKLTRCGRF